MTNQEIALEITKILKPDIDHYTRHHNDGDRFETRKRVYAETYLYFLNKIQRERQSRRQNRGRIKSRVTASIPAGMSAGTFSAYIEAA